MLQCCMAQPSVLQHPAKMLHITRMVASPAMLLKCQSLHDMHAHADMLDFGLHVHTSVPVYLAYDFDIPIARQLLPE